MPPRLVPTTGKPSAIASSSTIRLVLVRPARQHHCPRPCHRAGDATAVDMPEELHLRRCDGTGLALQCRAFRAVAHDLESRAGNQGDGVDEGVDGLRVSESADEHERTAWIVWCNFVGMSAKFGRCRSRSGYRPPLRILPARNWLGQMNWCTPP